MLCNLSTKTAVSVSTHTHRLHTRTRARGLSCFMGTYWFLTVYSLAYTNHNRVPNLSITENFFKTLQKAKIYWYFYPSPHNKPGARARARTHTHTHAQTHLGG